MTTDNIKLVIDMKNAREGLKDLIDDDIGFAIISTLISLDREIRAFFIIDQDAPVLSGSLVIRTKYVEKFKSAIYEAVLKRIDGNKMQDIEGANDMYKDIMMTFSTIDLIVAGNVVNRGALYYKIPEKWCKAFSVLFSNHVSYSIKPYNQNTDK